MEYRLRRGEHPTAADYRRRFHAHESIVEFVFHEAASAPAAAIPSFLIDHPRYAVERLLGCGGMGSVYLAKHRMLERAVALKVINPALLLRPWHGRTVS